MPNIFSVNALYRPNLFYKKISASELVSVFEKLGFKLIEKNAYSKLPNPVYAIRNKSIQSIIL
jgi:hypothetical protein